MSDISDNIIYPSYFNLNYEQKMNKLKQLIVRLNHKKVGFVVYPQFVIY